MSDIDQAALRAKEDFDAFYRRSYRGLVALGAALTGSAATGEDLAQEALLAAMGSWDRVSRLDHPAAWVRRVVSNQAVSRYRRLIREAAAHTRLSEVATDGSLDLAARSDVWNAVRSLPHRQAVTIALRYLNGLTLDEIAEVLGCSKSSANTHLRRAHEKLAGILDADWSHDA